MPSQNVLLEKQKVVADISAKLNSAIAGVLVDYKGINVENDTKLRKELREAGVDYSVVKNTLLLKAAAGTYLEDLKPVLEGTTALAVSKDDYVVAARILAKYADKDPNFKLKAGFLEGKVVDAAVVKELSAIPSKEILIAKVLGGFNAPITGLVYVLSQIAEQKGA